MTSDSGIHHDKQQVRERIWALLEQQNAVPERGVSGHIPVFHGAEAAARRLAALPAWHDARVVKANPDRAQLPVRALALAAGKTVYMAVPNLADPRPFYLLDPTRLAGPPEQAASSQSAATSAPKASIEPVAGGRCAAARDRPRLQC